MELDRPLIRKQMVSPKTAAVMLDCSSRTIRRYIKAGKLSAVYITERTIRIPVSEIEALKQRSAA